MCHRGLGDIGTILTSMSLLSVTCKRCFATIRKASLCSRKCTEKKLRWLLRRGYVSFRHTLNLNAVKDTHSKPQLACSISCTYKQRKSNLQSIRLTHAGFNQPKKTEVIWQKHPPPTLHEALKRNSFDRAFAYCSVAQTNQPSYHTHTPRGKP